MNTRAIFAIIRKDLKVVSQNKGVVLPIIIVPLVMFAILPWVLTRAPALVNIAGVSSGNVDGLIARMPAGLQGALSGLNINQQITVFFLVYMMAPFFLIIPLMVASTIAADSFAGEKERKTMEALLYTPTTDRELFIAKLLSGWLAAIAVALAGFALLRDHGQCSRLVSNGSHLFPKRHVAGDDLLGGTGFARSGLGRDGAGIVPRPGLPGCLPAGQLRGVAGGFPGHYADVRRHLLQCHAGVPTGVGYLAAGRTADLAGQPQLSPRPVDGCLI